MSDRVEPDHIYIDGATGEEVKVVGKLLPLAPSPSSLPRAPESLQICPHCKELAGRDLSDCPYCLRRMTARLHKPLSQDLKK